MAIQCEHSVRPNGRRITEIAVKHTSMEISKHLSGVSRKITNKVKAIERDEAKSWAKAQNRKIR